MSIIVRKLEGSEIELANSFFNRIYGLQRSLDTFKWEFLEGPSGPAIYVCAIDSFVSSNTIVGIQCAIPINMVTSKGKTVLTAKSEDTLVDPNYRGQKIFERMYDLLFNECRNQGVQYIWGFTPAKKAFERIGFEIPFQSRQALLVFNPVAAYRYLSNLNSANTILDKCKIFGLCVLSLLKGWRLRSSPHSGYNIEEISPGKGTSDMFQAFYADDDLANLHQTDDFLDWRLTRNPYGNDYHALNIFYRGDLVGHVTLNFRGNVSYIEQMLFKKREHMAAAIPMFVNRLKKKSALVRVLSFRHNTVLTDQEDHLASAGFTVLNRGNSFVWKSLVTSSELKPDSLFLNRLFTQGNM